MKNQELPMTQDELIERLIAYLRLIKVCCTHDDSDEFCECSTWMGLNAKKAIEMYEQYKKGDTPK